MNDDIVARLRAEIPCWCDAEPTRIEVRNTCWEASAEIERLRYELVQANNQIKLLIAIETAGQVRGE